MSWTAWVVWFRQGMHGASKSSGAWFASSRFILSDHRIKSSWGARSRCWSTCFAIMPCWTYLAKFYTSSALFFCIEATRAWYRCRHSLWTVVTSRTGTRPTKGIGSATRAITTSRTLLAFFCPNRPKTRIERPWITWKLVNLRCSFRTIMASLADEVRLGMSICSSRTVISLRTGCTSFCFRRSSRHVSISSSRTVCYGLTIRTVSSSWAFC